MLWFLFPVAWDQFRVPRALTHINVPASISATGRAYAGLVHEVEDVVEDDLSERAAQNHALQQWCKSPHVPWVAGA